MAWEPAHDGSAKVDRLEVRTSRPHTLGARPHDYLPGIVALPCDMAPGPANRHPEYGLRRNDRRIGITNCIGFFTRRSAGPMSFPPNSTPSSALS